MSLGLYWWHPIAWLVRREIRVAEELACDARVVSQRPADRRAYAAMLVKTVAFLSSDDLPSLVTGVGTAGSLEERLRQIMHTTFEVRVSRPMKVLVCLTAILFLPLAPILIMPFSPASASTAP
jgi:bla regulator protein BlaR1